MSQAVPFAPSDASVRASTRSTTVASHQEAMATAVATGSLTGLAILLVVMLAALFTQTAPYPPLHFAPLFGTALALIAMAITLIRVRSRLFLAPVVPVIGIALLSAGPQKLYPGESDFFAQTPAVYPVIIVGTVLIASLIHSSRTLYRAYTSEVTA